jgi:hypothetical protein
MTPFGAMRSVNLVGGALIRLHLVVAPTDVVRRILPPELDLLEQALTPPGTHPIAHCFQQMQSAHMTIPTMMPLLTYYEHITGIPFTAPRGDPRQGPCLYMPRLHLDNAVAVVGGVLFWGFTKRLSRFTVDDRRWAVATPDGRPVATLDIDVYGEPGPVDRYPNFEPLRRIMSQPLISLLPATLGPYVCFSDFDKRWDTAVVRPASTKVTVHHEYVSGIPCGVFPSEGMTPGIDRDPLGSVEVRARFRQSLVRPRYALD